MSQSPLQPREPLQCVGGGKWGTRGNFIFNRFVTYLYRIRISIAIEKVNSRTIKLQEAGFLGVFSATFDFC